MRKKTNTILGGFQADSRKTIIWKYFLARYVFLVYAPLIWQLSTPRLKVGSGGVALYFFICAPSCCEEKKSHGVLLVHASYSMS